MDGYTLTDKMRKTRLWYKLTSYEQLLYLELVAVCNDQKWKEVFQCSNAKLCTSLNFSEKTLVKARKSLINAGLIFYQSGKSEWRKNSYSFITDFEDDSQISSASDTDGTSVPHTDITVPQTDVTSVPHTDITSVPAPDNKDKTIYKTPPISPDEISLRKNPLLIPLAEIENKLLADESWKEQTAMQSGLSIKFIDILPTQLNIFLQYIIATGQEDSVQTLSDAKRRFFWWWKNHRKNEYEQEQSNNEIIIW